MAFAALAREEDDMARKNLFEESALHLRRGFRVGAAIVAVCAAVLLVQDVLPHARSLPAAKVVVAASVGPVAGVGTLAPRAAPELPVRR
jgi:hypothetical protein